MSICTFFGHSDCYGLDEKMLLDAIEKRITKGVDTFYVGNQGHFDSMVLKCLKKLKGIHSHITFTVVLAYLPARDLEYDPYHNCGIYPEGVELGPTRFAIERRNKWMIAQADYCLCYVNRTWGGAYKFAKQAKRKGLTIMNMGSIDL